MPYILTLTESYVSPPFHAEKRIPVHIDWETEVPEHTALKFQLRWADRHQTLEKAVWHGPDGPGTYYDRPGRVGRVISPAPWLQYRAVFVSLYDCASPRLREVRIDLQADR